MAFNENGLASAVEDAGGVSQFLSARFKVESDFELDEVFRAQCEAEIQDLDRFLTAQVNLESAAQHKLAEAAVDARNILILTRQELDRNANEYRQHIAEMKNLSREILESQDALADERLLQISSTFAERHSHILDVMSARDFEAASDMIWEMFSELSEIQYVSLDSYPGQKSNFDKLFNAIETRATLLMASLRKELEAILKNTMKDFGWPMSAPTPDAERDPPFVLALTVLLKLQMAAVSLNKASDIGANPSGVVSAWAIDCILSPQIDRFRYHFRTADSRTGQDDHPEWPANFVVERITESAGFFQRVVDPVLATGNIDPSLGTRGSLEFARGLTAELSQKLLMSLSDQEDSLAKKHRRIRKILQIAETTDRKMSSLLAARDKGDHADEFPSLLTNLARNEQFLEAWVGLELATDEPKTTKLITELLKKTPDGEQDLGASEDELAASLGRCPGMVWNILDKTVHLKFFHDFELATLSRIRDGLQNTAEEPEWSESSNTKLQRNCRVASLAFFITRNLQERGDEPEYLSLQYIEMEYEDDVDADLDVSMLGSVFDMEAAEYENLLQDTLESIRETIFRDSEDQLKPYSNLLSFGELQAPDADEILAYDLTPELCDCLGTLEDRLHILSRSLTSPKLQGLIWRPLAESLDEHIFGAVMLSAFLGGPQGTISPVQSSNGWLGDDYILRATQQVVFDLSTLVDLFKAFTSRPEDALWRTSEGISVFKSAFETFSSKIVVKSVEEAWTLDESDERAARDAMEIRRLGTRELIELLVICQCADIC